MAYYPSACSEIPENDCTVCVTELARVRKCAIIHKSIISDILADIENINVWDIGRSIGKIFVYPETQGEYDGGVPITVRGFMSAEETVMANQFSATIKEPNYIGNRNHWNALFGNRNFYLVFCSETIMRVSTKPVTIIPIAPIANDLKQEVVWGFTAKWTDDQFPTEYNVFDAAFDCEYQLVPPPYFSFSNSFDNSFDAPDS
jgi:hypothetical protein